MYSNIDNRRQNPTLKLISAIDNIKLETTPTQNNAVLVITFYSQAHLINLNNWEASYFPATFPTMFFFGNSGHLENREQLISIEVWAKWTLQHHFQW